MTLRSRLRHWQLVPALSPHRIFWPVTLMELLASKFKIPTCCRHRANVDASRFSGALEQGSIRLALQSRPPVDRDISCAFANERKFRTRISHCLRLDDRGVFRIWAT